MTDTPSHADTLNALETLLGHPHIATDLEPELRDWKSHVQEEMSARRAADDALGEAFRRRLDLDMSSVSNASLAWAIWCALDDVNARVVTASELASDTPVGYVQVRDVPAEGAGRRLVHVGIFPPDERARATIACRPGDYVLALHLPSRGVQ